WQQAQPILEILSSLSYRNGKLDSYLQAIAGEVSCLLELDWSVVTLCRDDQERVMASNLDLGDGPQVHSLHGTLTNTVVQTGQSLCVEDAIRNSNYGKPPPGYRAYLGVPLRTCEGEVMGTICSFCIEPRQFNWEEVKTVELFAERAATAIDNYNLYHQQLRFNQVLEAEVEKRTSELKEAQAQLIERERLAAIGEFAAMIVHEIRNPMTTIMMGLKALTKLTLCDRDQTRLRLALEESNRLQKLLKEILLYAKPQLLQLEQMELNSFLEELLANLCQMPEAQRRHIKFIPLQPTVTIMGDKDKLKQVLVNLVGNACEAIAPGEVVTCTLALENEPDCVCLTVHNGGVPIPAEVLPKITQPFCSTKPEGTGLGLAIVKRIIEAHQGNLSIESDSEQGTIISITLPIVKN
ncbi:MAG: GAF domain-containing protein, partial [Merismopedia sp. SIO2A8]|nr:GAF domain-containing protein [Merismopedia sp. SIO2A8]